MDSILHPRYPNSSIANDKRADLSASPSGVVNKRADSTASSGVVNKRAASTASPFLAGKKDLSGYFFDGKFANVTDS